MTRFVFGYNVWSDDCKWKWKYQCCGWEYPITGKENNHCYLTTYFHTYLLPTPNQLPYLRLHWLYHPLYLFCWCSALLTLHSYALDTPPYRSNCSQRWFVTVPKLFAKVEMQLSFASCVWHEIVPELRNRKVKTICINKKNVIYK